MSVYAFFVLFSLAVVVAGFGEMALTSLRQHLTRRRLRAELIARLARQAKTDAALADALHRAKLVTKAAPIDLAARRRIERRIDEALQDGAR